MRRASKVDANHADIVRAMRQAGASVLDLSDPVQPKQEAMDL